MKSLLICAVLLVSVQLIYSQERISFQINAGPVFVSSSHASTGYGAAISLLYPLSDKFDLSFRTGYLKWTSDGDALSLYSYSDKLTFIPILAGARYYFFRAKFQPYISAEGGYSFLNSRSTHTFTDHSTTALNTDFNGYLFGAGIGTKYVLTPDIKLDAAFLLQHPEISSEYMHIAAGLDISF